MSLSASQSRSPKPPAVPAAVARAAQIESDDEDRYRPIQWPLIKRLLASLAPFKWWYIGGTGLGLCQVLLDMLSPLFLKYIIDFGTEFAAGQHPGLSTAAASWHVARIIAIWTLAFIGSVILQRFTILLMTSRERACNSNFAAKSSRSFSDYR